MCSKNVLCDLYSQKRYDCQRYINAASIFNGLQLFDSHELYSVELSWHFNYFHASDKKQRKIRATLKLSIPSRNRNDIFLQAITLVYWAINASRTPSPCVFRDRRQDKGRVFSFCVTASCLLIMMTPGRTNEIFRNNKREWARQINCVFTELGCCIVLFLQNVLYQGLFRLPRTHVPCTKCKSRDLHVPLNTCHEILR